MPNRLQSTTLLLGLLVLLTACDKMKSHLNSLLGREEAVNTVVQTEWEAAPEAIYDQIKVEDGAKSDEPAAIPAPLPPPASKKATQAEAKPAPKTKTTAKAEPKAKETATASAALMSPPPPAMSSPAADAPPPEGSIYSVQVGAFASVENAERLKVKLAQQGFTPIIETIRGNDGREWQALRIGKTDNLQEAKELAVNYANANHMMVVLLKHNRIVQVIRSAPPAPLPPPVSTLGASVPGKGFVSTSGQLYTVQVGGLFSRDEAETRSQKIAALGMKPRLVPQRDKFTGEMWYVIHLGEFSTRELAGAHADELQRKHGWVTSVPEP